LKSQHYFSISKGTTVDYVSRTYDDTTGEVTETTETQAASAITDSNQPSTLTGWYYIYNDVDLNYRPVVNKTANIVLADNCTLTANGGIEVPNGCTLNIYGQTEGTGTLKGNLNTLDTFGDSLAFIGEYSSNSGTLNLYGGNIKLDYTGDDSHSSDATGDGPIYVYAGSLDLHARKGIVIMGELTVYGGKVNARSDINHAMAYAPTYGKSYIPKVTYKDSDGEHVEVLPVYESVYIGSRSVSIENAAGNTGLYEYYSRSWNSGSSKVDTTTVESQECITLDENYFRSTLDSGWYAVVGNVTATGMIDIKGEVNLILTDDCTLTAAKGIHLTEGNTLKIYSQKEETGKLTVTSSGANSVSGICGYGDTNENFGELYIYGGTVTSDGHVGGSEYLAGSTGKKAGDGGTIEIYGGELSVSTSDTAIGGGDSSDGTGGNGGTIKVYGGKLNAESEKAAIGGGATETATGGKGADLYVYGGEVTASSKYSTAIGGGSSMSTNGAPGTTMIYGGSVTAYSERDGKYAFDHTPSFGAKYIPNVSYGDSKSSAEKKTNPETSVYTSNKYVSIESVTIKTAEYKYLEYSWDGSKLVSTEKTAECTVMDNDYFPTSLSSGWYAISGFISNPPYSDIEIDGEVNIILASGSNAMLRGNISIKDGGKLNIFEQKDSATKGAIFLGEQAISGGKNVTLNIHGGKIIATVSSCGNINIYNGTLTADASSKPAIEGEKLSVYGGTINAESSSSGAAIDTDSVDIYGGTVTVRSHSGTCAFANAPTFHDYIPKVTYGADEDDAGNKTKISPADSVYTLNKYVKIEKSSSNSADYEYYEYSWDGSELTHVRKTQNCITLSNDYFPTTLTNGWYAISEDVTISDRIEINGTDVNLILTDGHTLTAKGDTAGGGIHLPEGKTLNIYAQSGGSGKLIIDITEKHSGIGGNYNPAAIGENSGDLNIHGGIISVTSNNYAAIGGGSSGNENGGNGGTVKLYNGQLTVRSPFTTAIGGGSSNADGKAEGSGGYIYIYGGELNASSGGKFTISAITHIYGGSVTAQTYTSAKAFANAPTFHDYIPKVSYGEDESYNKTSIQPDDSVYTSNKYVKIEQGSIDTADYKYYKYTSIGTELTRELKTQNCVKLTNGYFPTTLTNGWYALGEDVTVSDRIEISGTDVNLILTDGCTLTAENGIHLTNGNRLYIYMQEGESGKLKIEDYADNSTAAIGGNYSNSIAESCGDLSIHGGIINVSAIDSAAIGGADFLGSASGNGGNGGTIDIYAGELTVSSGSGAAIGGGRSSSGNSGEGGIVSVYGGKLNASSDTAAAIGGGRNGNLYVYGGEISAKSNSAIAISGSIRINNGSVTAQSVTNYAFESAPDYFEYIPQVSFGDNNSNPTVRINPNTSVYTSNKYVAIERAVIPKADYDYYKYELNGSELTRSLETQSCVTLNKDYFPTDLDGGWYAVAEDMTIDSQINISGTVNLILTDGHTLTVNSNIHLMDGNVLNIYVQNGESGKLTVNYTGNHAAIGGFTEPHEKAEDCGELNIYGGTINVSAAGGKAIGGGNSLSAKGGNGGTIKIYSGELIASSESDTAIGGGYTQSGSSNGAKGNTYIYGGSVTAKSGSKFAFDNAPVYGAGYIPNVTYGASPTDASKETKISPDSNVYTGNPYVLIEQGAKLEWQQRCHKHRKPRLHYAGQNIFPGNSYGKRRSRLCRHRRKCFRKLRNAEYFRRTDQRSFIFRRRNRQRQ